jgi:hypothetical protein
MSTISRRFITPQDDTVNLYLKRDNQGAVMLCDELGNFVRGTIQTVIDQDCNSATKVTATLLVCGWVE